VEPGKTLAGALLRPAEDATGAQAALAKVRQLARDHVDAMARDAGALRVQRVVAHVRRGDVAEGIARLAAELDADLVVIGSRRDTPLGRLVGAPVAERIARVAPCPVYIVRPKAHAPKDALPASARMCRDCLAVRAATDGDRYFCPAHAQGARRATYTSSGISSVETIAYEPTPPPHP
jgi:nucleotide-binding universal stress UspA family protein